MARFFKNFNFINSLRTIEHVPTCLSMLDAPDIIFLQPLFSKRKKIWALPFSLAATKGINIRSLFLRLLRCFTSAGILPYVFQHKNNQVFTLIGFPHSEISGSKVANHLPEAYRRHATSFIVSTSLGIHHLPVNKFG